MYDPLIGYKINLMGCGQVFFNGTQQNRKEYNILEGAADSRVRII